MEYLEVVEEELEYICEYGPPDRKEFLYEYEDPSYDGDGVCIEQYLDIAFDDIPY